MFYTFKPQNYAITEFKCLAIIDAFDKFHYYVYEKTFTIHTDHYALVHTTCEAFNWQIIPMVAKIKHV